MNCADLKKIPRKLKKELKKQAIWRARAKRKDGKPWQPHQVRLDSVYWESRFKSWWIAGYTLIGNAI